MLPIMISNLPEDLLSEEYRQTLGSIDANVINAARDALGDPYLDVKPTLHCDPLGFGDICRVVIEVRGLLRRDKVTSAMKQDLIAQLIVAVATPLKQWIEKGERSRLGGWRAAEHLQKGVAITAHIFELDDSPDLVGSYHC
jgi:hypothetical protein